MVTEIVRPDDDVVNTWTYGDWDRINDDVTQPTPGDGFTLIADYLDDSEVYECSCVNPIVVTGVITSIVLWIYGHLDTTSGEPDQPSLNIYADGGYLGEKTATLNNDEDTWTFYTWSGLNLSTGDDLKIWIQAGNIPGTKEAQSGLLFDVIYLFLTAPTGPAGIAKVYGIESGSIAKKYGVNWSDIAKIYGIS